MESSLLVLLHTITDKLKTLSTSAQIIIKNLFDNSDTQPDETLQEAEIVAAKLQALLQRLSTELNNYFRLSAEPSADEVSEIATVQLEAEETLCELSVKIKGKSKPEQRKKEDNLISGKLPKLDLPRFDGNVLDWHTFWDQFSSNIHNRNLPDVDKLSYLKAALKGDAKNIIDGLDTTNKNYKIAIEALRDRYGRTTQIIDAHYSALYKVSTADKTVTDCRRTLDEIERHLRVLDSLGEDINHNHLRFLVTEKFPEDIIYEMKMKIECESIEEMRKHLKLIITAREESNRLSLGKVTEREDNYTIRTLHTTDQNSWTRSSNKQKGYEGRNPKSNERQPQRHFRKQDARQQRESSEGSPGTSFSQRKDTRNLHKRKFSQRNIPARNVRDTDGPEERKRKFGCIFCKDNHFNDECDKAKTVHQRKLLLKNRCFRCLRVGHNISTCKVRYKCPHCQADGKHNRALCPKIFAMQGPKTTNTLHVNDEGCTILQTAVVTASKEGCISSGIPCRILMDSGSQRTYITQSVAKALKLQIEEESRLTVFTFGSKSPQEIDSPVVKLLLKTRTGKQFFIHANVVPIISHSVPYSETDLTNWKDRSELADDGSLSDQIDILIGNDYYFSLISNQKIKIQENLFLVQSDLGWILSGKPDSKSSNELSVVTYFQSCIEVKLNEPDLPLDDGNLKNLWDLESIGITDSPKDSRQDEAVRKFNETTECIDHRYYVSFPWVEYPPELTSNLGLAHGRLVSLLKRLDAPTLYSYNETLKEQMQKSIIEVVPNSDRHQTNYPIHYLPHHGVKQPGKPVRIVYDASSKTKDNKSLNQCLYCGPILLEDLTGLLIRFRCHTIAICADVEKAFLQLALKDQDRDVTRFLWLKDIEKPATEENILHLRFCRVPFGIISSPFLLNATIRLHLGKSRKEQMRQLAQDIYVDNIVTGAHTVKETMQLYKEAKATFQEISMNLREWSSNSREVMEQIPDTGKEKDVKVLGLNWKLEEDILQIKYKTIYNKPNTKRDVLRIIASIYDPCGYAVPTVLPAKLFIQDLWKQKVKWDEPFSEDLCNTWSKIQDELDEIKDISLYRCYFKTIKSMECQLHCFTDSSIKAYAAAVYVVSEREVSFVIGKSRLVPIKDQDNLKIPLLELLGVLIGSRLMKYTLQFLPLTVTRNVLWTDSQIVIDWCNSDKLLPPFVARRVKEIKQNKDLIIKYVPTEFNPADVATRPASTAQNRRKWLAGPQFLLDSPDMEVTFPRKTTSLLLREDLPKEKENKKSEIEDTVEIGIQEKMEVEENEGNLQKDKIGDNKIETLKKLQAKYFSEELEGKETNLKRNLGLFLDVDGILRCKGRLVNTDWTYDKCHPILIPKECDYTNKIILETHNDNYHVGANHTLSIIRQNFWIPQGKRQVQKIIKKCPRCIKHGGGPFKLPPTPGLPPERVKYTSPFTFTGLDYMGPLLVKTESGTSKRWIALFTCLAVRAVHLEIVQDLTAEECLLALRRMVSTRGVPQLITSDNATNFKLTSAVLSNSYCIKRQIHWRFIPQLAPWFGGFYERLIGIVKHCMKRTLMKHLLTDSQLNTVVKEIEAVVNTRPLTCVDSELIHILKPSDFLTIGKCLTFENTREEIPVQGTATKSDLIKAWKRGIIILNEFKDMFSNHYLSSLRERYRNSPKEPRIKSKAIPQEGQIVQIKEDNKNRENWKVGKIVSLVKGSDGLVRVANVRSNGREYLRSLAHLYPLEVENDEESDCIRLDNKIYNEEIEDIPTIELEPCEVETATTENVLSEPREKISEKEGLEDTTSQRSLRDEGNKTKSTDNKDEREQIREEESIDEEEKVKETRQRRNAATRALEKIKQWTRNLLTIL